MMRYTVFILIITFAIGCGGSDPASVNTPEDVAAGDSRIFNEGHSLWGLWNVRIKADGSEQEISPLRRTQLHLNALKFLEPPPNQLLRLESIFVSQGKLNANIGLIHPFPSYPEFTGFDVRGIVILPGNETRCTSDFVTFPGIGETRLINADGYTRWWNPLEFPQEEGIKPVFGYIDGLLGTPDETADYLSTLNGYKYFADDLGIVDEVHQMDTSKRGMFGSGAHNSRRYQFEVVGPWLAFNYAVSASWAIPINIPPVSVPGDFPSKANQSEPYAFEVEEIENTLYNDGFWGGGDYELDVTVYTWRELDSIAQVTMEMPGAFGPVGSETPVETGDGWAKYSLRASGAAPVESGEGIVLIRAACSPWRNYNDRLRDTPLSAFYVLQTTIGISAPGGPPGSVRGFHYYEPVEYEDYCTYQGLRTCGAADSRDGYTGILTGPGFYGSTNTYLIESTDGGNSFEPELVSHSKIWSGSMLYGPNGAVHAFDGRFYYHRPDGNSNFKTIAASDDPSISNGTRTAIELDETTGRLHAFAVSIDRKHVYHLYSDDYENFSDPEIVFTTPYTGFVHFSSVIGMDTQIFPDGSFGFVTPEYDLEGSELKAHVYYRSGQIGDISPPVQLDVGLPADYKAFADIVLDPAGTIHIVWLDESNCVDKCYNTNTTHNNVYYSYSLDGISFSLPQRISYEGAMNFIPALDMSLNGAGLPVIVYPVFGHGYGFDYTDLTHIRIRQITIQEGSHPLAPVDVIASEPEPVSGSLYNIYDLGTTSVDTGKNAIFFSWLPDFYSNIFEWEYY